jgi:hypothetical protein
MLAKMAATVALLSGINAIFLASEKYVTSNSPIGGVENDATDHFSMTSPSSRTPPRTTNGRDKSGIVPDASVESSSVGSSPSLATAWLFFVLLSILLRHFAQAASSDASTHSGTAAVGLRESERF